MTQKLQTPHFHKTIGILISGPAGAGKTTLGEFIMEYGTKTYGMNILRIPFANPLKKIAGLMGWDGLKDEKGRKLLQELGDVGREYNKDTWINLALRIHENSPHYPADIVIFDDFRYPNELDKVKNNPLFETFTIRIVKAKPEIYGLAASHPSETSLTDDMEYDYKIVNPKPSLTELENLVPGVMEQILTTKKENFTWI